METKDKKEIVMYYTIETQDSNSRIPEDNYEDWDEISSCKSLDAAKAEYGRQLATHDTLRLVQVTRTTITQSYKARKFISELEQGLKGVEEHIRECLVKFLKNADCRDYFCNIQLTNGDTLTEMTFDIDHETMEVIIYGRDNGYSKELSQLSIEDQLTILKVVAEKH